MAMPMGGDLGGTGDGLPKFEVGDGSCIRPPNIWRNSVKGREGKYEVIKQGDMKEFMKVFLQEKGHIIRYIGLSDSRDRQKTVDD